MSIKAGNNHNESIDNDASALKLKLPKNSETEFKNGLCQNLASFFESIKGNFTHTKHQKIIKTKRLTLQ